MIEIQLFFVSLQAITKYYFTTMLFQKNIVKKYLAALPIELTNEAPVRPVTAISQVAFADYHSRSSLWQWCFPERGSSVPDG